MQNALISGPGKLWLSKGRIFIGDCSGGRMHEGTLYEMQPDQTYNVFKVKYDPKNGAWPDDSLPLEKTLISTGITLVQED